MQQVQTVEEVLGAARIKTATKADVVARARALGLPAPPIVNSVAAATVEYTFVSPISYVPRTPDEVFCVITDQALIADINRRHRETNSDPRLLAGGPPLPVLSNETPICIARTVE